MTSQQQQQPRSGRQMVFVRQSVVGHVTEEEELQTLAVVQDQTLVDMEQLFRRINYGSLGALYLVDCHLELGDGDSDILAHLPLSCLVLSHNQLRRIPRSVFQLAGLKVLKVDRNRLTEIPSDLEKLSRLETLCCDRQRPRLRCLPSSIQTLRCLRVLSFADNRIEDVSWVARLTGLRTLICRRNRIRCLPEELVDLPELRVLDISHNRIQGLHHSFTSLIRRLYRFEYCAASLRPRYVADDLEKLLSHLELEQFLDTRTGCFKQFGAVDLTLAVVGETFAGKTTLVEALKTDRGTHRQEGGRHQEANFDVHHFGVSSSTADSSCQHCYVSAAVMSREILDGFCRDIRVDLFVLVVDLTSLELKRGGHQLVKRHLGRFQMWLRALYELSPDTPVLVVGTHAELIKPFVLVEIWKTLEGIMSFGRFHHSVRFASERCPSCILCQPPSSSVRHPYLKTRNSSGGFVDTSAACQTNPATDPATNEHISSDDAINSSTEKMKLPHVVGYYEVDCRKVFPKDGKKTNTSVEHLKSALLRFAVDSNRPRVPAAWLSFLRNIASIRDKLPNLPCIPTADVFALARSFEISTSHVPFMLRYMHQRGKALFFDGDSVLSKVVVLDVSWFARAIGRLLDGCAQSSVDRNGILEVLTDPELDKQLKKSGVASASGAEWLLRAMQRLGLCVPLLNQTERLFIPDLLELGSPSPSVWPEIPDWEEKQITCEIVLRTLRPSFFADLVVQVNRLGRRTLQIRTDPLPIYLANHIVFHTNLDRGGCHDCSRIRRRMRKTELCDPDDEDSTPDDPVHKVHIALAPSLTALSVQVRGRSPCCVVKTTIEFLELYIDDVSETDNNNSDVICSYREANATCRNGFGGQERCSRSETKCSLSSVFSMDFEDEEEEGGGLEVHLLCPKCVLLRNLRPERIRYPVTMSRKRAICSKWHNLGSWNRVYTGDYRHTSLDINVPVGLTSLSEQEHPRLLLLLPPSKSASVRDWYLYRRMKFLEGLELHFLCEYTGFWHLTDDPGYRLTRSGSGSSSGGCSIATTKSQLLPVVVQLALPLIQCLQGVGGEYPQNARLLAPVVSQLIRTYECLQNTDRRLQQDPCAWLAKHKDRVVSVLTKTLMNANEGPNDVYTLAMSSVSADAVFQSPAVVASSRRLLARFLRVEFCSGRFGSLRPVYVGNDVRWVCETHYEELRTYVQNNRS